MIKKKTSGSRFKHYFDKCSGVPTVRQRDGRGTEWGGLQNSVQASDAIGPMGLKLGHEAARKTD